MDFRLWRKSIFVLAVKFSQKSTRRKRALTVSQYAPNRLSHPGESARSPHLSFRGAKPRTPGWPLLALRANSPSGNLLEHCTNPHNLPGDCHGLRPRNDMENRTWSFFWRCNPDTPGGVSLQRSPSGTAFVPIRGMHKMHHRTPANPHDLPTCHSEGRSPAPQGGLSWPFGPIHLLGISWNIVQIHTTYQEIATAFCLAMTRKIEPGPSFGGPTEIPVGNAGDGVPYAQTAKTAPRREPGGFGVT